MKLSILLYDGSTTDNPEPNADAFGLVLYGGLPDIHDYHANRQGAMGRALKAAAFAAKSRMPIVAVTTLTRSNYLVLSQIVAILKRLRIQQWLILPPSEEAQPIQLAPQRYLARFALAFDKLRLLGRKASSEGIKLYAYNFPACLTPLNPPDFTPLVADGSIAAIMPSFEPPNHYADKCANCNLRSNCPGIASTYVSLYGDSELTPAQ